MTPALVLRILNGLVEEWKADEREQRIWFRMNVSPRRQAGTRESFAVKLRRIGGPVAGQPTAGRSARLLGRLGHGSRRPIRPPWLRPDGKAALRGDPLEGHNDLRVKLRAAAAA